ncbi:hypothetical protein HY449_04210 [Candidatus Pacearchaeota archaeon]|nr:hypothetical protein [Candidatus Pacearchaeota archaeon]
MAEEERVFGYFNEVPAVPVLSETERKPLNLELEVKFDVTKRTSYVKSGKDKLITLILGQQDYFQLCEEGKTVPIRKGNLSYEVVIDEELADISCTGLRKL